MWTKPSTSKDWLSLEQTNFPPKKEGCTHQQVLITEGKKKEMEADITTQ
jgi:hypothetical protein